MKKNNYNIKQDLKKLSSEDIAKHQDFGALLKQFQATETPPTPQVNTKVRRLWQIGLAAAAVFAGLLLYSNFGAFTETTATKTENYLASQDYVNPPIKEAQAAFASYTVDAYSGGTYEYKSGSKLVIPPKAFVNRSGNFAMGEVEIKYREYHDYVDFFMSGIPMEYDSAGVNYILESAGMIEIYAEQGGERLDMVADNPIEVELISNINLDEKGKAPKYNIYKLDKENRNWVYQDVDNMTIVEEDIDFSKFATEENSPENSLTEALAEIDQDRTRQMNAIEASIPQPKRPTPPSRGNELNYSFDLDILSPEGGNNLSAEHQAVNEAQAEIAALQQKYAGIVWEVLPNQPQFNTSVEQTIWEDFKLDQTGTQNYVLTLIGGQTEVKVNVQPVLLGEDYDNARSTFEAEMAAYSAAMAEREQKLQDRKATLNSAIALAQEIANKEYEERRAAMIAAGRADRATDEMLRAKVLNRFQVRSFGIWNCDRPLPPYIYAKNGTFENQKKDKYENNIAYIVDKNRNTIRRFYIDGKTTVQYDKNTDNLMWIVTRENRIAVYRPEDFDKIKEQQGEHTFVMNLVDQEINSEEDARKILDF